MWLFVLKWSLLRAFPFWTILYNFKVPGVLLMAEILLTSWGCWPQYLQGCIHPRWCRTSSINSMLALGMVISSCLQPLPPVGSPIRLSPPPVDRLNRCHPQTPQNDHRASYEALVKTRKGAKTRQNLVRYMDGIKSKILLCCERGLFCRS